MGPRTLVGGPFFFVPLEPIETISPSRARTAHQGPSAAHIATVRYAPKSMADHSRARASRPRAIPRHRQIGRAHVCTVTNAHLVCRLLLDKKKNNKPHNTINYKHTPYTKSKHSQSITSNNN